METSGVGVPSGIGCHAGWLLLVLFWVKFTSVSGLPTLCPMSKMMLLPPPSFVHTYMFPDGLQLADEDVAVSVGAKIGSISVPGSPVPQSLQAVAGPVVGSKTYTEWDRSKMILVPAGFQSGYSSTCPAVMPDSFDRSRSVKAETRLTRWMWLSVPT
jgi:hypothetical protein